jgi:hypothetical protein
MCIRMIHNTADTFRQQAKNTKGSDPGTLISSDNVPEK